MASYVRRIGVEVYGNVSGFLASLNQMNAGITRTASGLRSGSREAGVFSGQLRAIGTTAKYALAGELVFGITGALSKLSQLQVALGNISTVATQPGGGQGLTGISKFRQELIALSNDTVTPVQNLTDSITALYSSLAKNLPQSDVLSLTKQIAMIARTGQVSNPQDLVGALLGGATAFGMPQGAGAGGLTSSVAKLGDQFKFVLQKSRNMTGEEYAQYSGNLYKRAGVAGLSPEQTGALAIQSTMLGGPASTNMQNLSQFLLYLRNPKSAASKAAYAQAGISQTELRSSAPNTAWNIIQQLIGHANSLQPGERAGFINSAFGRMQSQSTFATLLKAGGMGGLNKQVVGLVGSVGDVKKSFDDFKNQAPLAYLANTLTNLGTTLAGDVPGLSGAARHIGGGLEYLESPNHEVLRRTLEGGVAGILASRTAAKFFPGLKGKGGILGRTLFGRAGKGIGGAAVGAGIMAEEANSVISGAGADGSRANPYWVIISPWSWTVGSPGGFGSPVGTPHEEAKTTSTAVNVFKKLTTAGGGALAARLAVAGGAGVAAALVLASRGAQGPNRWKVDSHKQSQLAMLLGQDPHDSGASPLQNQILDRFKQHKMSANDAERRLVAIQSAGNQWKNVAQVQVAGEAHGNFKVTLVDKNGNIIGTAEEKGVPVKLWNAKQFPTSGGKPGQKKGSSK